MKKVLMIAAVALVSGSLAVQAVVIDSSASGWYRQSDGSCNAPSGNATYITVGRTTTAAAGTQTYRNFFAFDLANVLDEVYGAYLEVWNPTGGFFSPVDGAETYTLFDVETAVGDLGGQSTDIYNDLGSGVEFGSYAADASDNGTLLQILLNADAVAAINAARGDAFAVGGAITSLDGRDFERFLSNGRNDPIQRRLVLDTGTVSRNVPDYASTLTLLGMAIAGMGMFRRRG